MADNMFNNEHVIHGLSVRLVPTGGEYPDCIANVILTERYLYALEDNYDGTVTPHIKVPIKEIMEIGAYTDERTTQGSGKSGPLGPLKFPFSLPLKLSLINDH